MRLHRCRRMNSIVKFELKDQLLCCVSVCLCVISWACGRCFPGSAVVAAAEAAAGNSAAENGTAATATEGHTHARTHYLKSHSLF